MTDKRPYRFTAAVYEHAAKVIGRTPWEVSRDHGLLVTAQQAAYERYRHTPVMVGIDIYNLEAEAYGADIVQPEGEGIPSVSAPLCDVAGILRLKDFEPAVSGRLGMVIEAARELTVRLPDAVVKVPVSGPFSLAATLCGLEALLCEAQTEPETVRAALKKLTENQLRFCRAMAGVGITVFESAASPPLVPPAMFKDLVLPALRELTQGATEIAGSPVPCIIGGNTTPILDLILSTGTQYVICPSETDQPAFMEHMTAYPDVLVRVNMRPAVFCSVDTAEAFAEADRVMALAGVRRNVCLGSGVLPYEAIPETVLAVKRYIEGGDS